MRILFRGTSLPKKAAKRLKDIEAIALSEAQEIVSRMLGYSSWHELHRNCTDSELTESKSDEECSDKEQYNRLNYQASILERLTQHSYDKARGIALSVRVSCVNPSSSRLIDHNVPCLDINRFCGLHQGIFVEFGTAPPHNREYQSYLSTLMGEDERPSTDEDVRTEFIAELEMICLARNELPYFKRIIALQNLVDDGEFEPMIGSRSKYGNGLLWDGKTDFFTDPLPLMAAAASPLMDGKDFDKRVFRETMVKLFGEFKSESRRESSSIMNMTWFVYSTLGHSLGGKYLYFLSLQDPGQFQEDTIFENLRSISSEYSQRCKLHFDAEKRRCQPGELAEYTEHIQNQWHLHFLVNGMERSMGSIGDCRRLYQRYRFMEPRLAGLMMVVALRADALENPSRIEKHLTLHPQRDGDYEVKNLAARYLAEYLDDMRDMIMYHSRNSEWAETVSSEFESNVNMWVQSTRVRLPAKKILKSILKSIDTEYGPELDTYGDIDSVFDSPNFVESQSIVCSFIAHLCTLVDPNEIPRLLAKLSKTSFRSTILDHKECIKSEMRLLSKSRVVHIA